MRAKVAWRTRKPPRPAAKATNLRSVPEYLLMVLGRASAVFLKPMKASSASASVVCFGDRNHVRQCRRVHPVSAIALGADAVKCRERLMRA